MSQRKLELLISIVTRNRKEIDDLIRQLNALNKVGKGYGFSVQHDRGKTPIVEVIEW